jgi:hypothetical protein
MKLRHLTALAVLLFVPSCENPKPQEFPIRIGDKNCGKAVISIAAKDNKDGVEEGAIVFDFQGPDGAEGCCKSYGWIQHVKRAGVDNWRYDNSAFREGVTGAGIGAESDPQLTPQPTEKDRPASGAWKGNPWYGAPTDPAADKQEFAKNPTPQKKIGDKPGDRGDAFRTQLICVDTGEVLFTWAWTAAEPSKGEKVPPPK